MSFDPAKPVQCRDGRKARIVFTDSVCTYAGRRQPIIAEVETPEGFRALEFFEDGRWRNHEDDKDLINIPEEKWRPWTRHEFPLNAIFKFGETGIPTNWIDLADRGVVLGVDATGFVYTSFQKLLENWIHTVDLGKTWHKCGVKIQ